MATVPWAVHPGCTAECTGLHWVALGALGGGRALSRAQETKGLWGSEERVTQRVLSEDSLRERMAAASS